MQGPAGPTRPLRTGSLSSKDKEWRLLWRLFITHEPAQQEQLCRELLALPVARINRYMLQFVYLAVCRPCGPLEDAIVQLCGSCLDTALQVSWLLLALLQDQPGNRHVKQFRDACERAALTGGLLGLPFQLSSPLEQQLQELLEQQQDQPQLQQQQQQQHEASWSSFASSSYSPPPSEAVTAAGAAAAASSSDPRSNPSSPALASPTAASSPTAATAASSSGSVVLPHRFRDSLDLEMMRHASKEFPHAAAAAGAAAGGGSADAAAPAATGAAAGRSGGSRSLDRERDQQQRQHDKQQLQQQQQQQQRQQQRRPSAGSKLPRADSKEQQQPPSIRTKQVAGSSTAKPTSTPAGAGAGAAAAAGSSSSPTSRPGVASSACSAVSWAVPGSAAASSGFDSFDAYLCHRRSELVAALGPGEGVSSLIAASHDFAASSGQQGWLVTHEEDVADLLSTSALLALAPPSPRSAAARDSYLASLDLVEALCETSSNLTRFPHDQRRRVLRQCLARINAEVEAAAEQGVAVRWPIGGCRCQVLRLLVQEAVILNSRDKAPFLLMLEVQQMDSCADKELAQHDSAAVTTEADDDTGAGRVAGLHLHHQQHHLLLHGHHRHHRHRRHEQQEALEQPHSPQQQQGSRGEQQQQQAAAKQRAQIGPSLLGRSPSPPRAPGSDIAAEQAAAAAAGKQAAAESAAAAGAATCNEAAAGGACAEQQQAAAATSSGNGSSSGGGGSSSSSGAASPEQWDQAAAVSSIIKQQQRQQSALEQQMREAADILRGERLVRLDIRVLDPATGGSSAAQPASAEAARKQQQLKANGRTAAAAGADDGVAPPPDEQDGDEALWLFGELPAASSSSSICHAAAAAAAGGTADGGGGQLLLQVVLEVAAGAPVVQQLAMAGPGPRVRRRLPSLEAIDIIAGKLGKSCIPPPPEIGPPLRVSAGGSSSSSIDGDPDCRALSPRTLPPVAEGSSQAAAAPAAAAVTAKGSTAAAEAAAAGAGADGDWQHIAQGDADTIGQQQEAAQEKPAVQQQPQKQQEQALQQQQQPARPGLWGFLNKSFGPRQQQQQQQQEAANSQNQRQQQQPLELEKAAAAAAAEKAKLATAVFGERLSERSSRVAAGSPLSSRPGWQLAGAIIKSGDDCRQELLALQLIREFRDIWKAADLPLWLQPFEVVVTSNNTALIQLIPDATSIHSIKARSSPTLAGTAAATAAAAAAGGGSGGGGGAAAAGAAGAGAPGVSLSDHFFAMWGRGTPQCLAAQRRFVESLAGYSLVTHLLQVKDRHNGNIMMDDQGRLIHIDFGFLLSNAPGGGWVCFESSPMKLTRELLEVMGSNSQGQASELFDYFKVLCIQGFLAARKERSRIVGLVRIMADCCRPATSGPQAPAAASAAAAGAGGSAGPAAAGGHAGPAASACWPCFQAGPDKVVAALEARFMPGLTEAGCVQHVLRLISSSLDAWSTRQYDAYQRVLNGIL